MTIRTATPHDLDALRALFTASNDAPYDLATVAGEKSFGMGVAGSPVTRVIERDGRIVGAAVVCGKWLRIVIVARDARRKGFGSRLLADDSVRGATIVAAEPGNYFTPGIADSDAGTLAFFHHHGFRVTQSTTNLEVLLEGVGSQSVPGMTSALPRRPSRSEAPEVLEFIEREFGRIWRFEADRAFEAVQPSILITGLAGAITGFAAWESNNRGLGWFGPTGVARAMRGQGLGARLLLASLAELQAFGYRRAVIPWTDAIDFYRKTCGAQPSHRFVTLQR